MTDIKEIEGIGPEYGAKLEAAGVTTVEALLERGATRKGRTDLEAATGIGHAFILKWTNRADLFRVKGIGEEYSDLLEAAGVDTVVELAQRNAANLHATLASTNEAKHLVRRVPSESEVATWVEEAKSLPRVMEY
ncbi:MAG: DUF4332 domain-containing protein [Dehalococcoidia bacterium]